MAQGGDTNDEAPAAEDQDLTPATGPLFTTSTEPAAAVPALGGGDDLLTPTSSAQLLASLALVLAVIVALGWLSRRLHRLQPRRGRSLQVLDVLPVGARERVALVQVGGTQLVLGLAPGRVQTLHVLGDRAEQTVVQGDEPSPEPVATARATFASLLKR